MRVAVTGASGLIGTALVPHLRSVGHEVVRLVRRTASAADEVQWDPKAGTVDLDALAGVDGVVHLAGAAVGDHRWTDDYKREILDSRIDGTHTIARAMAALDPRPQVLVSASAIGAIAANCFRVRFILDARIEKAAKRKPNGDNASRTLFAACAF